MNAGQTELNQEKSANRLIKESSTYLLQHAFNPVNWYPWTDEALEHAIAIDKPIMLSIGYSACHWCHVMEEESFQDEETAKIINENFIPIKVDREERPDIDDIYMTAVQLMTGHGGWPLTVFLTPAQKPFYGGTYFPKEDKHYGHNVMPGFKTVLNAVSQAWERQRHEAEASATRLTDAIFSITQKMTEKASFQNIVSKDDLLIECAAKLLPLFDTKWGGFKGAPKFPQTLALQLCLQAAFELKRKDENQKAESLLKAISTSLDGMANGGIFDHLGGGFSRYSTDEKWLVPHFEKMLYDNALLVAIYLDALNFIGKSKWLEVASQTLDFISQELTNEQGGFYSALDADSEGVEGKFYVWKKSEIVRVLGSDSELFCQHFGVSERGNFEHNDNVLFLKEEWQSEQEAIFNRLKSKLLTERSVRIRPIRDDKILTSWNGLAISAFVRGYCMSGQDKYLHKAQQAAQFVINKLIVKDRLNHSFAKDISKLSGYLDDYSFFCRALIDLAGVDSDPLWLESALVLTDAMIKYFFSDKEKEFFYTASDQEELIVRPKNFYDGPLPSATSVAIECLFKMEIITGDQTYRQIAQAVLEKHQNFFYEHPNQYASMITVGNFSHNPPISITLLKSGQAEMDKEMLLALHSIYLPNKMVVIRDGRVAKPLHKRLSLLQQKSLLGDKTTVYICQAQSCQSPINDIIQAKAILNKLLIYAS